MAIFQQPRGSRLVSLTRCLRRDGSEFDAESSVGTLQSDRGAQLISVVRDVTERLQQQEKLREAARPASKPAPVALSATVPMASKPPAGDWESFYAYFVNS